MRLHMYVHTLTQALHCAGSHSHSKTNSANMRADLKQLAFLGVERHLELALGVLERQSCQLVLVVQVARLQAFVREDAGECARGRGPVNACLRLSLIHI